VTKITLNSKQYKILLLLVAHDIDHARVNLSPDHELVVFVCVSHYVIF